MNAQVPPTLDAGFALLDRQVLDAHEEPVAKVDDLEIAYDNLGRPYVIAMLCGPGASGPRLRDRFGRWVVALWQRVHPAVDPDPARIPMHVVARIDSAVHLSVEADATAVRALHDWALDHIISRIPGASHGAE
jgi:hypothetical protein